MLKFGDTYLNFGGTYLSGWKGRPIYNVNILTSNYGSVTSTPVSGYYGTTVTLSNTANANYEFSSYVVEGGTLYENNKIDLTGDVYVSANFIRHFNDTVTIGGKTWLSKNLDVNDNKGGIFVNNVNYGKGDVTEYYYTWEAAKRVANSIVGWHLPTVTEWNSLFSNTNVGKSAYNLKSTYGWTNKNGSNLYGFSIFPAGRAQKFNGNDDFSYSGTDGYFWAQNNYNTDHAYGYYFVNYINSGTLDKVLGCSIRLVKD